MIWPWEWKARALLAEKRLESVLQANISARQDVATYLDALRDAQLEVASLRRQVRAMSER